MCILLQTLSHGQIGQSQHALKARGIFNGHAGTLRHVGPHGVSSITKEGNASLRLLMCTRHRHTVT